MKTIFTSRVPAQTGEAVRYPLMRRTDPLRRGAGGSVFLLLFPVCLARATEIRVLDEMEMQ